MSNAVQFLEALSRNPKPLSADELSAATMDLEPSARQAIIGGDAHALNQVLGGRTVMMCLVAPAENDEPQEGEEQEDEQESPDQTASTRAA
jgi:hypothetical protein